MIFFSPMERRNLTIILVLTNIVSFFSYRCISRFSVHTSRKSNLYFSANRENNDMMIDESKLSTSEQERLQWIKKLSTEADEIVKAAGFQIDEQDEIFKDAKDTNWSGQSVAEKNILTSNNWNDLITRWPLVIGDVLALYTFAAIGRSNHAEDGGVLDILKTATPFLISWLAISPFLGAYSTSATSSKNSVFSSLVPAWAVSVPAGLFIRGIIKGAIPPTPFIIVSMIATFILISLWRSLYVALFGETSTGETRKAGVFEVFNMISSLLKRW